MVELTSVGGRTDGARRTGPLAAGPAGPAAPARRDRPRLRGVVSWPITFAHRGARAAAPENTIAAFRLGLEQGAGALETDAWLAGDGVPVLVHDATIRPAGRRIRVVRATSAELAGFGVPTLADLYRSCGTDFELSIDVEHAAVALPLLEVAESVGAANRLWLCADDPLVLGALRKRSDEARLVCSTGPLRLGGLRRLVPRLVELDVDVVNLHWQDWTARRLDLVHGAGLLAFGWDAQDAVAVEHLLALGIDGLYADRPDELVGRVRGAAAGLGAAAPDEPPDEPLAGPRG